MTLTAPFPWFGGKRRAASLIWPRFGDVPNYVEPFAGSLAVLLARPHAAKTETVNDRDAYLANFWRALKAAPEAVEAAADNPVNEVDLHARHVWLIDQAEFRERMLTEPEYFDARIAGWWVWGISCWIGSGWCDGRTDGRTDGARTRPTRKIPELGSERGIRAARFQNSDRTAASEPTSSVPQESAGRLLTHARTHARTHLPDSCLTFPDRLSPGGVFDDLADRLRDVRVACGDWSRVVGPSVTWRHGVTAILLDPPYSSGEHAIKYSAGGEDVAADVRAFAIEHGANPLLRIALCGYDGEHEMPEGWTSIAWKAVGGYGNQGDQRGRANAKRETIWFSPHCIAAETPTLFDCAEAIA